MTKPLADHGIATAAVPLPSCGEAGETLGDLYDDVDACRQVIAEAAGVVNGRTLQLSRLMPVF